MLNMSIDAKVRPLSNPSLEKASLLGAARIYVSKDSLLSLTGRLDNGKPCVLEKLDDGGTLRPIRDASLWNLPDKNVSPNIVMMTKAFQDASGFKLGDQVRITLRDSVPDTHEVVLQDVNDGDALPDLDTKYPLCWESAISISLGKSASRLLPTRNEYSH